MTQLETDYSSGERTQRFHARLSGFLFLWLIICSLTGDITISHLVGSGTLAETAKRVTVSQHLYRAALCSELIETLSALLLAFTLYATLRPVDKLLAQIAMYWRVGESFIGSVGVLFGFIRLGIYNSAQSIGPSGNGQSQALLDVTGTAGFADYNISAIFFSIGSILFFYLFFKSRYIPRILSVFGVFASVVVTIMCFGTLMFPERGGTLLYGWAPIALAEVSTGIWLMLFAVKPTGKVGA